MDAMRNFLSRASLTLAVALALVAVVWVVPNVVDRSHDQSDREYVACVTDLNTDCKES